MYFTDDDNQPDSPKTVCILHLIISLICVHCCYSLWVCQNNNICVFVVVVVVVDRLGWSQIGQKSIGNYGTMVSNQSWCFQLKGWTACRQVGGINTCLLVYLQVCPCVVDIVCAVVKRCLSFNLFTPKIIYLKSKNKQLQSINTTVDRRSLVGVHMQVPWSWRNTHPNIWDRHWKMFWETATGDKLWSRNSFLPQTECSEFRLIMYIIHFTLTCTECFV